MLACVDVGYVGSTARSACVTFDRWDDADASGEYSVDIDHVHPYVPGQFYRRELPCLLAILDQLPTRPKTIVVDGYVWLDDRNRKGLGGHLFAALDQTTGVIGVAKTRFAMATTAIEVIRGSSDRPLFVSSVGMNAQKAADCIRLMHGENRIPTLLKRVDRLSRVEVGPEINSPRAGQTR